MFIVMKSGSTREEIERVSQVIRGLGFDPQPFPLVGRQIVRVAGYRDAPQPEIFETLGGVAGVLPLRAAPRRAARLERTEDSVVRVSQASIGGGEPVLVAGPCAVEDEEQLLSAARAVKAAGADILRGGAYKPRTSPDRFQGLGLEGLKLLARARDETGLPVVTEAVDEASLEQVEEYADMIQIGARNMQNFELLKRAGASRRPVLLKRGMSAQLEDLLLAAEYVLEGGNPDVVLCERGIRTFSNHSRYTLDLSIVPRLKRVSHLPVLVDPSHASGDRASVAALARAALASGADGVMIEVHPAPLHALCDGPQSLTPREFDALARSLRALAPLLSEREEIVS